MSDRVQRTGRPTRAVRTRLAAAGLAIAAVSLTGCATIPAISEQYTPGVGTNVTQQDAMLRALVIVVKDGQGVLTGAALSSVGDSITAISIKALDQNDAPAGDVKVSTSSIQLPTDTLVQLAPQVQVSSPQLVPGLMAELKVTFAKAGETTLLVPVVSNTHPDYKNVQLG